ncbi:hypothetical protein J2Z62_000484 [Mycoplasmoides fastidiosum]|uniref:Transmembrane protein n=1 Tax=Mycoplasmoides fastidiosum TaxID=92758 RepID=A0ABU0LZA6_9BACT|nr:hypothetical protein [Mycoplasmoides fastidiosum]MDQ0514046.1 hypothetical protein [Mycoplasmoides fastidiosum]UUD37544.1 hypothetical protein NPA10_03175 [Mycoplasmoides fastidiosum]
MNLFFKKKTKKESKNLNSFTKPKPFSFGAGFANRNKLNNITDEKADIIAKSIPSLNVKKRIVVTGFTLITLLAFLSAISTIFYIIAISHSYAIGVGSYSNYNDLGNRIFFVLLPSFWSDFILAKTGTIYSFFRSIQANIIFASNNEAFVFALSFYISFFAFLTQCLVMITLLSIAIYQKIIRNIFIALFSLIPILGTVICVYYLGVLHFEHTFKYQKIFNRNNTNFANQDLNLKEQLDLLNESIINIQKDPTTATPEPNPIKKIPTESFKTDEPIVIETEAFSFEDPIGK